MSHVNKNQNNTHDYKFQENGLKYNENQENIEPNSVNSIVNDKVPKNSTVATTAINFTEYSGNVQTTNVFADESEMGTDVGYSKNVEDTDGYVADNESNMTTTVAN